MKIIVLGSGLVGRAISVDLARDGEFRVTAVDHNPAALEKISDPEISKRQIDLSKRDELPELLKEFDIVLNAVPGFMGFKIMESIISAGRNVVDIAFYSEDPFKLDQAAKNKEVTALVDCGVSPGLSNMVIGHAAVKLDKLQDVKIYVGGLPEDRSGFFEYKVVFSVSDVMEEYIRPARLIENGKRLTKPALSEIEEINFQKVGRLEAFNSDGLRTLLQTINADNMVEKTLRYPGHAEKMRTLVESGLMNKGTIDVNGVSISPFDVTAKLLSNILKYEEGNKDITILKVIVNGKRKSENVTYEYNLFDRYNDETKVHSMARTTGYTASMCVRLLASGMFDQNGIVPPELIGKDEKSYRFILEGLKERDIVVEETIR